MASGRLGWSGRVRHHLWLGLFSRSTVKNLRAQLTRSRSVRDRLATGGSGSVQEQARSDGAELSGGARLTLSRQVRACFLRGASHVSENESFNFSGSGG